MALKHRTRRAKRRNKGAAALLAVPVGLLAGGPVAAETAVPVVQPLKDVAVRAVEAEPDRMARIAPAAPAGRDDALASPPEPKPFATPVKATARPTLRPSADATPNPAETLASDGLASNGLASNGPGGADAAVATPPRQVATAPAAPDGPVVAPLKPPVEKTGPTAPRAPAIDQPGTQTVDDEAAPAKPDFAAMRKAARQLEVPQICTIIEAAADRNNLPKPFLARLIWKESRFDVRAVSPVGALGIAQFMPATAKLEGLLNPFDPHQAIHASAKHLADMRREFGNLGLAAIGYNAGRARARAFKGGRDWLPAETVDYVISILGREARDYADGSTFPVQPLKKGVEFAAACRKLPVIPTRAVAGLLGGVPAARQPWHVQVSRHFARHVAVNMFKRAQKRHASVLGGMAPIVVVERGAAGMRPQKSVRVGAPTQAAAQTICRKLRSRGGFCLVKRNGRR